MNPDRFIGTFPDAFQWHDVTRQAYWQIAMGSVTVNAADPLIVCEGGCQGKFILSKIAM